ncbi:hypothetical protein MMC34_008653, partial [Xylographa carneopallida]|nr:hypothetical protein [Xylographa carneopallida]
TPSRAGPHRRLWSTDTARSLGRQDRRHPSDAGQLSAVDAGHGRDQPDQEPAPGAQVPCPAGSAGGAGAGAVMHHACHVSHGSTV